MRTLALLLLLANLTFLAFSQLDRWSSRENNRIAQQVHPDKVKLLSMKEVAALSPGKAAQVASVCLEWGPFAESERARAQQFLEPFQLGKQLAAQKVEVNTAFWVFIPPLPNKPAIDKKIAELRDLGVRDFFLVQDNGAQKNAISLGVFKTEEAANNHLTRLQNQGVRSAKAAARQQAMSQTLLVVYDPPAALTQRIQELKYDFPSAELKSGSCTK